MSHLGRRAAGYVGAAVLVGGLLVGVGALANPAGAAPSCTGTATITCTFSTVGTGSFMVPSEVTQVSIDALGAQGGPSQDATAGGKGGSAVATIDVTPAEVLQVNVGGQPASGNPASSGFNGGAAGGTAFNGTTTIGGGGGGGASDVRTGSFGLADRVVIGGGGGGGGSGLSGSCTGGAGGGASGSDGGSCDSLQGGGGTQFGGGGGASGSHGSPGSGGQGDNVGNGGVVNSGGGGGGGLFGGGGAAASYGEGGGGGGGSGLTPSGAGMTNGAQTGSGEVTITYTPGDLALTSVPANITINATSPNGATVTYTAPTAVDPSDATPPAVICTRISGSTFPIGQTTVHCSATDSDDPNSPVSASFNVTVINGALTQLQQLLAYVNGLPPGTSLPTKVQTAINDYEAASISGTCTTLTGVINEAKAQAGKHLTPGPTGQAAHVITAATQIRAVIGC